MSLIASKPRFSTPSSSMPIVQVAPRSTMMKRRRSASFCAIASEASPPSQARRPCKASRSNAWLSASCCSMASGSAAMNCSSAAIAWCTSAARCSTSASTSPAKRCSHDAWAPLASAVKPCWLASATCCARMSDRPWRIHASSVLNADHRLMASEWWPGCPGFSGTSMFHIDHGPVRVSGPGGPSDSARLMNCCGLNASCHVASGGPGGRPSAA